MNSYIYISSPYSHVEAEIRQARHDAVEKVTAKLLSQGFHVFSPIVHCHPMAVKYGLPKDIDFWHRYDTMMVSQAAMVVVLRLDGWDFSKGVAFEIELATSLDLPILFMDP